MAQGGGDMVNRRTTKHRHAFIPAVGDAATKEPLVVISGPLGQMVASVNSTGGIDRKVMKPISKAEILQNRYLAPTTPHCYILTCPTVSVV